MREMFQRRIVFLLSVLLLLIALTCGGCKKSATTPPNTLSPQPNATNASSQNGAIEAEIVAPQAIAGSIVATGKILLYVKSLV
jgi:hypothetical protein